MDKVKTMSGKIKDFRICQIPRMKNKKVDALANLTSIFAFISNRSIPMEFLVNPNIKVAKLVFQAETDLTWTNDIIAYL